MEPECVRTYLREPWRRPVGQLRVIGADDPDDVPPALDGAVPAGEYRAMRRSLADRAARFRGGRIHIGVVIFQASLCIAIVIGVILTVYVEDCSFFNPISLGVLGTLEAVVLFQAARLFQREERELQRGLQELFRPWQRAYNIVAKVRKTRGRITS